MHRLSTSLVCLACAVALVAGCAKPSATTEGSANTIKIEAGPDAHKQAQAALINAKSGDVIQFGAGKFEFTSTLSCDVSDVTVRGQGSDKTILAFSQQGQGTGGEGLLITSKKNFTIEDLAVEDAKGDAIKVNGCDGITFRKVRVSWTGGPKETNGAYGLYPVLSQNVLIEDCVALDAADAGIYVGQSENIIVRRNRAEHNVAGIEIENSVNADVYENIATNNTGGILVFSLPDLPKKIGHHCRVYNNQVIENNHENFAPKGTAVAGVPAGTGVMILANRHVEVFDNTIENNQTSNLSIISYLATGNPYKQDPLYDPFCEAIYVHDNKFVGGGDKPSGRLGELMMAVNGGQGLPDIVYDGIINPEKAVDGKLPPELAIRIQNNGDADFINCDLANINLENPAASEKANITRDLKPYEGDFPKLEPVSIAGVK
ncbi:MAG: parallel beta-helix domain-containing protein [Pirellulales bacterium]